MTFLIPFHALRAGFRPRNSVDVDVDVDAELEVDAYVEAEDRFGDADPSL